MEEFFLSAIIGLIAFLGVFALAGAIELIKKFIEGRPENANNYNG